jgi:acyl-CoA hydrolase
VNGALEPRSVGASASEYSELALPNDANPLGDLLGGRVMHLVDMAGALAAMRHARRPVVLRSSVNRAFRTSMEVGVRVDVEDLTSGAIRHTSSAYLTFVALDDEGRPTPVPPVILESPAERRRYEEAERRRERRLEMGKRARGAGG